MVLMPYTVPSPASKPTAASSALHGSTASNTSASSATGMPLYTANRAVLLPRDTFNICMESMLTVQSRWRRRGLARTGAVRIRKRQGWGRGPKLGGTPSAAARPCAGNPHAHAGGGYLRYRPGEEGTAPLPISLTNGQGIPHAGGSLCVAAPNFGWFSKQTSSDHHPILAMRCARAQHCNLRDRAHVVAVTVRAVPLYACRGASSCPVSLSLRGATGVGRNGRCMKYVPQVCSVGRLARSHLLNAHSHAPAVPCIARPR